LKSSDLERSDDRLPRHRDCFPRLRTHTVLANRAIHYQRSDIRMNRVALCLAALVVAFAIAGCDEKLSDITGPTPTLEPTFTSIQRNVFNASDLSSRLACVPCHNDQGRTPAGGLVLLEGRAYQNLVGTASTGKPGATRVIPGDPDNSYIVKKLEGASDINGERMPRGVGPFLSEGQMLVIRRWIQQGAQNN
jgi:hypothetical protein